MIIFHQTLFDWRPLYAETGFDCWVGNRQCAAIRTARRDESAGWRLIFAGASHDSSLAGPDGTAAAMARGRAQHGPFAPAPRAGELCWVELSTADTDRADPFWTETLGWTLEPRSGTTLYAANGRPIATRTTDQHIGQPLGWLCYFAVDGLDKAGKQVGELGGHVLDSREHPVLGDTMLIADPEGTVCALTESTDSWGAPQRG